jgi:hypothetical protein
VERIAHAKAALNVADKNLDEAIVLIAKARDKAEKQFITATNKAERWSKDHKVSETLLTRDQNTNKILDMQTQAVQKRIDDLNGAEKAVIGVLVDGQLVRPGAKQIIEQVVTNIDTASKDDILEFNGMVGNAADKLSLARSSLTDNFLTPYNQPVGDVVTVVGALTFALGLISLGSIHGKAVMKKRPGWLNSLAFFIAMIVMALAGFLQDYASNSHIKSICGTSYFILFDGALKALSATMFSLVAFYIVSAAYRAFRVKSTEAGLMMAAAFIIMLAIVPFGVGITNGLHGNWSFLRLENIGHWILNYPNAAAQRGIMFGIGVGGLAMAIRLWLSLERGSYFDKQM